MLLEIRCEDEDAKRLAVAIRQLLRCEMTKGPVDMRVVDDDYMFTATVRRTVAHGRNLAVPLKRHVVERGGFDEGDFVSVRIRKVASRRVLDGNLVDV